MSVMKAAARRPESGTKPWPRSSTFGRTSQNYFYAMGFAQGETLENLIKRSGLHVPSQPVQIIGGFLYTLFGVRRDFIRLSFHIGRRLLDLLGRLFVSPLTKDSWDAAMDLSASLAKSFVGVCAWTPSQLSASPCGGVLGFGIQDGNLLWAKRARRRTSSARGAALTRLMAAWQARKIPQRAIFYSKMAVNVWQKMRTDLHKLDREIREPKPKRCARPRSSCCGQAGALAGRRAPHASNIRLAGRLSS
jgi:hypothetical protein